MRRLLRSLAGAALMLCACATPTPPPAEPSPAEAPRPSKVASPGPSVADDGPVVETATDFGLTPAVHRGAGAHAPISLVAADGKPLKLAWVESKSVVAGPLAFTELHLSFDNPQDRTIEGRFRITLPEGASVSRLAMKIGSRWQEGEVVELKQARRIYEDFLHQRVDPALLEQGEGNSFGARVFPIRARERKELIISYSQEVRGAGETLVPLAGVGELEKLSVRVSPAKGKAIAISKKDHVPGDVRVDAALRGGDGIRNGDLFLARVTPVAKSAPTPLGRTLVLVDTSASRAFDLEDQLDLAAEITRRVADEKGSSTHVTLACFDQTVQVIYDGPAGELDESALDIARRRRAMGASNLRAALSWARDAARKAKHTRVVLLTDGVATAGGETDRLVRTVGHLRDVGIQRLDAVAFGGIRDGDTLRAITTAGLSQNGVVLDATSGGREVVRRLELSTASGLAVNVEGARWVWPRVVDGVQPGDEIFVYAQVANGEAPRIRVGERNVAPAFESVERPLLERAWAKAKIASLLDEERRHGSDEARRHAIVKLGTRHRVISPYTSLLVLETQRDYDRYGLARNALADILSVEQGRLRVLQRTPPPASKIAGATPPRAQADVPVAPWADPSRDPTDARGNMWGDEIGEAFGAGGLGLSGVGEGGGGRGEAIGLGDVGTIGHGAGTGQGFGAPSPPAVASAAPSAPPAQAGQGQGFGSGSGRLGRSHRARPPRVRMGATAVSGRLPPEVIQRIVRMNFGRFRACYEEGLRTSPNLQGRVTVRFVIARDGSVANASASSDLGSASVEQCITRSFFNLTFPVPEGGIITVSYPLVFTPDGSTPSPPPATPSPARDRRWAAQPAIRPQTARGTPQPSNPYRGRFASVMAMLEDGDPKSALDAAESWHRKEPGEVLAVVALGEALEANGRPLWAARAYGSIIDLFPSRADLRRFAGSRLERVRHESALSLAADTYAVAREQRPDHPTSHRLLGYSLLKKGDHAGAFDALEKGLATCKDRYLAARPIFREDLGLVAAAWLAAAPSKRSLIEERARESNVQIPTQSSLHFVLSWETDTNDVDLHVYDAEGGHAFYSAPALASGGRLTQDVTTGYGPESFRVKGDERSTSYRLQAHYYSRGPMGYGMGKVQVIEHDGRGGLHFDERPFVVMVDRGFVDLGVVGCEGTANAKGNRCGLLAKN